MRFLLTTAVYLCLFGFYAKGQDTASSAHKRMVIKPYEGMKIIYQGLRKQPEIPDGYYKVFYLNQLVLEGSFNKGSRHGSWTRYGPHRKPLVKGSYVNGIRHGSWLAYYPNGDLKASWWYYLDQKVDEWETRTLDNKLLFESSFQEKGLPKNIILHYEDGKIGVNQEFTYPAKDTIEEQSLYYENYRIYQYKRLVNGKRDGPFKKYHKNSLIWEALRYKKDRLIEVEKMQSRSAQLLNPGDFNQGFGTLRRYYKNGLIYSHSQWEDGMKSGSYTLFDNGIEALTGSYQNNKPTGKWNIDDAYHNPQQELEFKAGEKLLLSRRLTSSNKTEAEIGAYNFNWQKIGRWERVNIYNEPMEVVNFHEGYRNGAYKAYDFGRIIRSEGQYRLGEQVGEWTYRNSMGRTFYREIHEKEVKLYPWKGEIDQGFAWVLPPSGPSMNRLYQEFNVGAAQPKKLPKKKERILEPILYALPKWVGTEFLTQPSFNKSFEEVFIHFKQEEEFNFTPKFIPPRFEGGLEAFDALLNELLKYSRVSLEKGVQGRVWVLLEVDEFGSINSCKVIKTLGYGLDESVKIGLERLPPLLPAEFQGLPIKSFVLASVKY